MQVYKRIAVMIAGVLLFVLLWYLGARLTLGGTGWSEDFIVHWLFWIFRLLPVFLLIGRGWACARRFC